MLNPHNSQLGDFEILALKFDSLKDLVIVDSSTTMQIKLESTLKFP